MKYALEDDEDKELGSMVGTQTISYPPNSIEYMAVVPGYTITWPREDLFTIGIALYERQRSIETMLEEYEEDEENEYKERFSAQLARVKCLQSKIEEILKYPEVK
jgi:hypothetical protein